MVRLIDAEHLKSRVNIPTTAAEQVVHDGIIDFINNEPTYENTIRWIKDKREKKTKTCHAISYGVRCSKCNFFQSIETNYCGNCGGKKENNKWPD